MTIEKTIDTFFSYTVPGYCLIKYYKSRKTDEPTRLSDALESDATKAIVYGVLIAVTYSMLRDNVL